MSSRRTLILVGAIVVGAIAALLILRYVGSIEDRANSENQLIPVVVAAGDIQQGEEADALIEEQRISIGQRRRADLPANTVTRVEDVKGQTAAIDLAAGEVITTSKFSGSGALSNSKSNVLEQGNVALTVTVDQQRGVAGLVQPGDFVNIMMNTKPVSTTGEGEAAEGEPEVNPEDIPGSVYVYQKVKVLAIGRNIGSTAAAAPSGGATPTTQAEASDLVTLQVPPEAAPVLAAAAEQGVRLTLVRPDYQPRPIPNVFLEPEQILPGELGQTPYDGAPAGTEGPGGGNR